MFGLPLKTAAVGDEEGRLFRRAGAAQRQDGIRRVHRHLGVREGVVGLHQPPLVGDEGHAVVGELEILLGLDLGPDDRGLRRVQEGLLALVADVDDDRLYRLVELLVEDAGGDELLTGEIPFPPRVQVQQLRIHQIRVADEGPVAFRVRIGLGRQFPELGTADRLGRAEAQLHVLGEVPGHGTGGKVVLLLEPGGPEGGRTAE